MQGPDSWAGRPRDIKTIRVSQLSVELRADFKELIGVRRWTTQNEVQRLINLRKFRYRKGDPNGEPS